jgi:hypothetical protein
MLIYVVTGWVAALFCANGLLSRASPTTFVVFALGAGDRERGLCHPRPQLALFGLLPRLACAARARAR